MMSRNYWRGWYKLQSQPSPRNVILIGWKHYFIEHRIQDQILSSLELHLNLKFQMQHLTTDLYFSYKRPAFWRIDETCFTSPGTLQSPPRDLHLVWVLKSPTLTSQDGNVWLCPTKSHLSTMMEVTVEVWSPLNSRPDAGSEARTCQLSHDTDWQA